MLGRAGLATLEGEGMMADFPLLAVLIVAAMVLDAAAFIVLLTRARRAGLGLFAAGFASAAAAVVVRSVHVGHAPMQNLFEVFLLMGALVFPLSLFCRYVLGVGGMAFDALLAAVVLAPAVFVFSPEPAPLPPALQSVLFVPHVAAYLAAYVVLAKATFQAGWQLITAAASNADASAQAERSAYRMVALGFPLLTAGLVLGAVWGKQAWGDWWNWDPKELWSLVTWLVFLAYLHLRALGGRRWATAGSVLVVAGAVCILITLFWVNLSRLFEGLHSYA